MHICCETYLTTYHDHTPIGVDVHDAMQHSNVTGHVTVRGGGGDRHVHELILKKLLG